MIDGIVTSDTERVDGISDGESTRLDAIEETDAIDAMDELGQPAASNPALNPEPRVRAIMRRAASSPELWFLAIAVVMGSFLAVTVRPLLGSDERDHFARAYQLSFGQVRATEAIDSRGLPTIGGQLPQTFGTDLDRIVLGSVADRDRAFIHRELNTPAPHGPKVFTDLSTTANYPPGAYVSAALSIRIARMFGASTLLLLYLARFAQLATYLALVALAIRRTPTHPWVFVACGLLPAALAQASSVTADTLTTGLSFFVVASALRLAVTPPGEHRRLHLIEAVVATTLLGLCKPPYVALSLLYLVAMWRGRHAAWTRWTLVGALGAGALGQASWSVYLNGRLLSADDPRRWLAAGEFEYAFRDVDTSAQIRHVVTHPWDFVAVIVRTAWRLGWDGLNDVVSLMGLYEISTGLAVVAVAWLLVSWTVSSRQSAASLEPALRLALVGVVVVVSSGVLLIAYAYWNALDAPIVDALPQRYWLPVLPAILLAAAPRTPKPTAFMSARRYVLVGVVIVTLIFVARGVERFHDRPAFDPSRAVASPNA